MLSKSLAADCLYLLWLMKLIRDHVKFLPQNHLFNAMGNRNDEANFSLDFHIDSRKSYAAQ